MACDEHALTEEQAIERYGPRIPADVTPEMAMETAAAFTAGKWVSIMSQAVRAYVEWESARLRLQQMLDEVPARELLEIAAASTRNLMEITGSFYRQVISDGMLRQERLSPEEASRILNEIQQSARERAAEDLEGFTVVTDFSKIERIPDGG